VKTYMLDQIRDSVDYEKQGLQIEEKYVYVHDVNEPYRILKLFQKAGHRYVEVDLQEAINFIAAKLAEHISMEDFLKELIRGHSHPEEIIELQERLSKNYAKVTPVKQCYSLLVGGKRGRPYEFTLIL